MDKWGMRKKGKLVKKSLRLFEGHTEILDQYFPRAGHSIIIRALVKNFVDKLENNINQKELPTDVREFIKSVEIPPE